MKCRQKSDARRNETLLDRDLLGLESSRRWHCPLLQLLGKRQRTMQRQVRFWDLSTANLTLGEINNLSSATHLFGRAISPNRSPIPHATLKIWHAKACTSSKIHLSATRIYRATS